MNKSTGELIVQERSGIPVYEFRGEHVVIDRDVAMAFGTETKRINEAKARNSQKFKATHAFKLTKEEFASLKSRRATSKGRGGWTRPPWAYTVKGIGRLAMIIDTPEALAASDRILDTFIWVQRQIAQGRSELLIEAPSQILPTEDEQKTALKIRKKLLAGVQKLADDIFTIDEQNQAKSAAGKLRDSLWEDVLERLRSKGLENEKLGADTERVLAEARKLNSEADGIDLDNLEKKIRIVERLYKLYQEMEPTMAIGLIGSAVAAPMRLASDDS